MRIGMNLKTPRSIATAVGLAILALMVPGLAIANEGAGSGHPAAAAGRGPQYAQNYPPPQSPPPGYHPPPCYAVTPGPFRGAARGAAGGAIFGGIAGNAGKGAAIGAGIGLIGGAARRASARSTGGCY
jgi:hypothetical protein